jgi:hypothetical protein
MNAIHTPILNRSTWKTTVLFALLFWVSSSLLLDLVIMPELYGAGMMSQPDFAAAGYSIFWMFNRIELICAALILTGILVLQNLSVAIPTKGAIALAMLLLGIASVYTYGLTPEMSALGMQLNLFNVASNVPNAMNWMHQSYWGLEVLKLASAGALIGLCTKTNS